MNNVIVHERIMDLQAAAAKFPQVIHMPTFHYFAKGMYGREIHIPAHTFWVGQRHTTEHFFIMTKGLAHVIGGADGPQLLRPPLVMVCQPGIKRAGYCYEDTIFLGIHRTDFTDVEDIRKDVTDPDPLDYYDAYNQLRPSVLAQLGGT
jgi:hypothetical protein